jgi:hypothetical protein
MPKSKAEKKAGSEEVIDSFESWLEKQPVKPARAKHGFVADAKIE